MKRVTKADRHADTPKLTLNRSRTYQTPGACAENALVKVDAPGSRGTTSWMNSVVTKNSAKNAMNLTIN